MKYAIGLFTVIYIFKKNDATHEKINKLFAVEV